MPAVYEPQQDAGFFPGPGRPLSAAPQFQPPQPYQPGAYAPQGQPQPYVPGQQPVNPYQPPQQHQPQQPDVAEKDDLGVPAYLRRGSKR